MTITLGNYTITETALREAEWEHDEDIYNGSYWYHDGSLEPAPRDDINWRSISAVNIPAVDADGNECIVWVELCRTELGDADVRVNGNLVYNNGWSYNLGDLEELIGVEIDDTWDLDYDALAEEFLEDHDGYIYVMDNERGFANEWTIYACETESEAKEIERIRSNTTRYDAVHVATYIADIMMDKETYKYKHGCMKCVGFAFATEAEGYGEYDED